MFLDPEVIGNADNAVAAASHVKSVPLLTKRNAKSAHHLRKTHSNHNQRVVLKSVLFDFPYNW